MPHIDAFKLGDVVYWKERGRDVIVLAYDKSDDSYLVASYPPHRLEKGEHDWIFVKNKEEFTASAPVDLAAALKIRFYLKKCVRDHGMYSSAYAKKLIEGF